VKKNRQALFMVKRGTIIKIHKLVAVFEKYDNTVGVCRLLNKPKKALIRVTLTKIVEVIGPYREA
jgi:hypothetical protein